jgi:hypothetical protein
MATPTVGKPAGDNLQMAAMRKMFDRYDKRGLRAYLEELAAEPQPVA